MRGLGDAKSKRAVAYRRALCEAQAQCPGDEIAQHRYAMRAANRVSRVNAARASAKDEQKIIAQALLDSYDKEADRDGRGPLTVVKTYRDFVIASAADGKLYQINYTVGDAGIIFGNPLETEGEHVPIRV